MAKDLVFKITQQRISKNTRHDARNLSEPVRTTRFGGWIGDSLSEPGRHAMSTVNREHLARDPPSLLRG